MSTTAKITGVVTKNVYKRNGPSTDQYKHGYLTVGQELEILEAFEGTEIEGNDIWYRTSNGTYSWSGAIEASPDAADLIVKPRERKARRIVRKVFGRNVLEEVNSTTLSGQKQVIINADDYGLCNNIDEAIEEAVEIGVLNSVACFATFPARPQEGAFESYEGSLAKAQYLSSLRARNPNLSIGLHFSMTAGKPCYPHLTKQHFTTFYQNDFWFRDISNLRLKSVSEPKFLDELELEFTTQLDLLAEAVGGLEYVEHISCHHNVLFYMPALYQRLLNILDSSKYRPYNIAIRSPLMWSRSRLMRFTKSVRLPISKTGIRHGVRSAVNRDTMEDLQSLNTIRSSTKIKPQLEAGIAAIEKNIRFPFTFNDILYGNATLDRFEQVFAAIGPDAPEELMLHLAKDKEPKVQDFPGVDQKYLKQRHEEHASLVKKNSQTNQYVILEYLQKYNVKIIPFRDVQNVSTHELARQFLAANDELD